MIQPFRMQAESSTRKSPVFLGVRETVGALYTNITQRHKGEIFEAVDIRQYTMILEPERLVTEVQMREHVEKVRIVLKNGKVLEPDIMQPGVEIERVSVFIKSVY